MFGSVGYFLPLLLLLPAGFSVSAQSETKAEIKNQAAKVLGPFKKELKITLTEALAKKGPAGAVKACHAEAPEVSQSLQKEFIALGRTSHRLRNQENAPAPWIKPYLEEYSNSKEGEKPTTIVVETEFGHGYLEPIYLGGMCLNCHGSNLSDSVAAKIKSLYPKDKATGFHLGDFRGFFWVEFRKPSAGQIEGNE